MITSPDIRELLHRETHGKPIVSVFLDLSVNSDNKRTHGVFLNRQRTHYEHPELERNGKRRSLEVSLDHVEKWLDEEFEGANRGAAVYVELGGDIIAALQLPEAVENRIEIAETPVVLPLLEAIEREGRYVVAIVDREHLKLLAVAFGRVLDERALVPDAIPVPHDVQAGGYSHKNIQQRKAEETKHFLRDFADELSQFCSRHSPEGVILLGTDENVARFREQLPQSLHERVVQTGHVPGAGSNGEVLERVGAFASERRQERTADTLRLLEERVPQQHFAVGGVQEVLDSLRQGNVETLALSHGLVKQGVRCSNCDVILDRKPGSCPYCGGETRDGVDLVEAMARQAAAQDARVLFTPAGELDRFNGAAALLRF